MPTHPKVLEESVHEVVDVRLALETVRSRAEQADRIVDAALADQIITDAEAVNILRAVRVLAAATEHAQAEAVEALDAVQGSCLLQRIALGNLTGRVIPYHVKAAADLGYDVLVVRGALAEPLELTGEVA